MFTLRNLGSHRRVDSGLGKFQSVAQLGILSRRLEEHLGWELVSWGSRVGVTQTRDRFSLAVVDPNGLVVKNLSGFATRLQAVAAGKIWIERAVAGAAERIRRAQAVRNR